MPHRPPSEPVNDVVLLFLRRMRVPLIVLIGAYAIGVGGMVLIPGVDGNGEPWHFDFLHAFYFVAYTGSTIGFGELPYLFTPAQRLWTVVVIFITVIAWLFAIGNILGLVQDPSFRRAIAESRFARQVRRQTRPFYLICGYGETGHQLVTALTRMHVPTVVIDRVLDRVSGLDVENADIDVPWLCANPRIPRTLLLGGVRHPWCKGLVAVADEEQESVDVGIAAKLLNPRLRVICRADSEEAEAKLLALRADMVTDPFETFGENLTLALRKPNVHALQDILYSETGKRLPERIAPPHGHWIVCGFGRLGRAVVEHLQEESGMTTAIVDPRADPDAEDAPEGLVIGTGADTGSLMEAGIEAAVGVIAGTDNDSTNLAILSAARSLRPSLCTVARQNSLRSDALFAAARADLVMLPSRVVVRRILAALTNPLLARFLDRAASEDERWATTIVNRLCELSHGRAPETWTVRICPEETPAVFDAIADGRRITLGHLLREPRDRAAVLPVLALMFAREGVETLDPADQTELAPGDEILFAGRQGVAAHMEWVLGNQSVLEYIEAGHEFPDGYLWRYLAGRRRG